MNIALAYDFETSGIPLFREPSEHPNQPHVVQLGACLADLDSRKVISSVDVIVRPDGWTIPDDVVKIHGITTERAKDVGIPESLAVQMLEAMWRRAQFRVGHNQAFDARIMRIALLRHRKADDPIHDQWKDGPAKCTQILATQILKLPPTEAMLAAGRNHYKSANLREAYKYFVGEELQNAHSAMVDAVACMSVYFSILDANNMEPQ